MKFCQTPPFRKRQFAAEIIVTCVRWYLRFSLSLRDVEELMAERGLCVDHTTIWRWTQSYHWLGTRRTGRWETRPFIFALDKTVMSSVCWPDCTFRCSVSGDPSNR